MNFQDVDNSNVMYKMILKTLRVIIYIYKYKAALSYTFSYILYFSAYLMHTYNMECVF